MLKQEHEAIFGRHTAAFLLHHAGSDFTREETYQLCLTKYLEYRSSYSFVPESTWYVRSVYWYSETKVYCAIDDETGNDHIVCLYSMAFEGFSGDEEPATEGDRIVLGRPGLLQTIENIHRRGRGHPDSKFQLSYTRSCDPCLNVEIHRFPPFRKFLFRNRAGACIGASLGNVLSELAELFLADHMESFFRDTAALLREDSPRGCRV